MGGSREMTSRTSPDPALLSTRKPSSETRISESSWTVSTSPRRPRSSRTTSSFVRNKDIRKFLDGIYVSQKTEILKDNELLRPKQGYPKVLGRYLRLPEDRDPQGQRAPR